MTGPANDREWRRAVPIDRYATILAHLFHFGPDQRGAVLERFGLDAARWEAVDAMWCAELDEVVRRRQGDLAMRFASVLARTRTRLAQEQPAVEKVGDAAPKKPPLQPHAEPPAEPAAQPLVPSYKLEERAAHGQMSWQPPVVATPQAAHAPPATAEDVAGTADVSAFVPRTPLPFEPAAAAPAASQARAPLPAPSQPWTPPPGSGTEDITSFVAHAATPFAGNADPRASAPQPRMRLVRFDPQTGQPLTEPRWEELPPEKADGAGPKP